MMRDMVGYGRQGAPVKWPNNARVAVNFVINYEAGAERSPLYGDAFAETYGVGFPFGEKPQGMRNLSVESMFEYESRVGFWRLTELFDKHQLPVTFFVVGHALSQHPPICEYLKTSSHEVAGHGWRWIDYSNFSKAEEKAHIEQCIDAIAEHTGKRPVGWYTGRCSEQTREILIELGGFLYDSDSYADDAPYLAPNTKHLIIPYSLITNDFRFTTTPGFNSTQDFFTLLKDTVDGLYQEDRTSMMTIGLHPRICGHPGRFVAIQQFLDYILSLEQVWIARRDSIASHWLDAL